MKHHKMEFTKLNWIWLCKATLEFNINSHLESTTNQDQVFTLLGSLQTDLSRHNRIHFHDDLEKVKYISKDLITQANPSYPSVSRDTYEGKFWNYIVWLRLFRTFFQKLKSHIVSRWCSHNNDRSRELCLERCLQLWYSRTMFNQWCQTFLQFYYWSNPRKNRSQSLDLTNFEAGPLPRCLHAVVKYLS